MSWFVSMIVFFPHDKDFQTRAHPHSLMYGFELQVGLEIVSFISDELFGKAGLNNMRREKADGVIVIQHIFHL